MAGTMNTNETRTTTITLSTADGPCRTVICKPAVTAVSGDLAAGGGGVVGPWPAVLFCMDGVGVHPR